MLATIESPSKGSIEYNDQDFSKFSLQQKTVFLQHNIGLIFQQPLLMNELSVLENIMLKQIIHGSLTDEHRLHAKHLLEQIGMSNKANCMPNTLSGGQQQRVALLRAVFHPPQFLFADEPTGNLDKESGEQVLCLLFEYQKKYRMGLIMSTHDMDIAQRCDHIVKIENKQIIF